MGATSIQDAKGTSGWAFRCDTLLMLIAAVLISSTKVADRNAGLKDLILILKHNRGKPSLEILGNKAYLALCETLFQCMRDERASLLRDDAQQLGRADVIGSRRSSARDEPPMLQTRDANLEELVEVRGRDA